MKMNVNFIPKENGPMAEESPESPDAKESPADAIRQVSARELLGPGRVLRIEHNGELYVLRLTRNDRLILTK